MRFWACSRCSRWKAHSYTQRDTKRGTKRGSLPTHVPSSLHGHGLSSSFLHLSAILVKEGQRVRQGDPIAKIGATGRATGPHLDWRMNLGRDRLDPQLLVGSMASQ